MAEEKKEQMGTCQSCRKKLPILDKSGQSNFFTIGKCVGFGSDRKSVCRECKLASRGADPTGFIGWGR